MTTYAVILLTVCVVNIKDGADFLAIVLILPICGRVFGWCNLCLK